MKSHLLSPFALICLALLIMTAGCRTDSGRLESALEAAGPNRAQLEAVMAHYADSPEKQAAARWLIANMPGHYGYEGNLLDSVETTLATLTAYRAQTSLSDSLIEVWRHRNLFALPRRSDLSTVGTQMLIDNIDRAYEQWKRRGWNTNLSFEDFCEYILPYRLGDERLTDWRPVYDSIFAARLDTLYAGDDVLEAVRIVSALIDSLGIRHYSDQLSTPHRDPLALLATLVGPCRDDCSRMAYAMRACGIPVAIDHLMPSPEFGIGHTWMSVLDTRTGRWLPFGYDRMPLTRDSIVTDGRVKGKVYRYTFAPQRAPGSLQTGVEIPSTHSRVLDVTANYFGHNRVEVGCEGEGTPLLAAWTNGKTVVIGTGKRKGDRAVFTDVEPGAILFPATARGGRAVMAGYPFIVEADGRVSVMQPDLSATDTVTAIRKIPLGWRKQEWLDKRICGMVIEASSDRGFTRPDTLIAITSALDSAFTVTWPALSSPARYIRISPSLTGEIMLAELTLSQSPDASDTIGFTIETPLPAYIDTKLMTDGASLTYMEIPEAPSIIARLARPSKIGRAELMARNDDNFIVPGREYELLWHDGPRGWQSAGRAIATERSVSFAAPKGAVCIVRCLTTGREEQPFVWRNRRQTFSLDLTKARYK
ncbi:MAG: hypothetical protein HDR77_12030 [Bacteroides sp.]|nr:hypothetical protein [Bacteroides sp.]